MGKIASNLPIKMADSKFETRNPKCEANSNDANSNAFSLFAFFERLNFEFVSDLAIRILNFSVA